MRQLRPNRQIFEPKLSSDFFILLIFFCRVREPAGQLESRCVHGLSRHFPIYFHNTWLLQEAAFSFRPLLKHLLFCGSRKQANRKCVKCPVPTLARAREPFIIQKVLWIFPKRRLDKHKMVCNLVTSSVCVLSNNKIKN